MRWGFQMWRAKGELRFRVSGFLPRLRWYSERHEWHWRGYSISHRALAKRPAKFWKFDFCLPVPFLRGSA